MVHISERKFQCDKCKKKFKTDTALKIHGTAHSDVRSFKCNNCQDCFKSLSAMRRHTMMIHTQNKSFGCEKCPKAFPWSFQLKRHISQVHTTKTKPNKKIFKCNKCDFVTNEQNNSRGLNIHKKTVHMGGKQGSEKCHDCSFEAKTEWKLYQHKLKVNFHKS